MTVYVYAVDPGTTSAVFRGEFSVAADDESLWDALGAGEFESWEVEGTPAEQAWEIVGEYFDWTRKIYEKIEVATERSYVAFAMEDFVIRLGKGASSRRDLLDPVRVAAACEALCWNRDGMRWAAITYQMPSDAKKFATNERLRRAGLWVKGSEHRRDATRHGALAYSRAITHATPSVRIDNQDQRTESVAGSERVATVSSRPADRRGRNQHRR